MLKLAVICTLSLGVGAGIGWTARGGNSPTESGSRVAGQVEPSVVAHGWAPTQPVAEPALDIGQLRAVLREELAAARSSKSGDAAASTSPPLDELAPPPAVVMARRDAMQTIDTMVASGQWGNDERQNFQQKLMVLDPQQAEQELQKVTMALNSGALQVHTDGAPL